MGLVLKRVFGALGLFGFGVFCVFGFEGFSSGDWGGLECFGFSGWVALTGA